MTSYYFLLLIRTAIDLNMCDRVAIVDVLSLPCSTLVVHMKKVKLLFLPGTSYSSKGRYAEFILSGCASARVESG